MTRRVLPMTGATPTQVSSEAPKPWIITTGGRSLTPMELSV